MKKYLLIYSVIINDRHIIGSIRAEWDILNLKQIRKTEKIISKKHHDGNSVLITNIILLEG